MKKILVVALYLAMTMLVASWAIAGTIPGSGIKATSHDLSSTGGGQAFGDSNEQAGMDRICIYCHAPHHTLKPADYAGKIDYMPLWNHALTTTVMWSTYTNGLDEPNDPSHASYAEANSGDPGGISKLCLSCHDGSVAANAYGFAPSSSRHTGPDVFVTGTRAQIGLGGDLSNHHPIGFDYAGAKASDDEIAATTTPMGAVTIADLLWAGKMECSSCHDVHNTKNAGEKFLWISDKNSALCLTCHLKNQ